MEMVPLPVKPMCAASMSRGYGTAWTAAPTSNPATIRSAPFKARQTEERVGFIGFRHDKRNPASRIENHNHAVPHSGISLPAHKRLCRFFVRKGLAFPKERSSSPARLCLAGRRPPCDLIQVRNQRFIRPWPADPVACARPAVLLRSGHQLQAHRIEMRIVDLLHKNLLSRKQHDVRVVFPKRITVVPFPRSYCELCQRRCELGPLEVIDNSPAGDTFYKPQGLGGLHGAIGYNMQMIRHDHIGQNE